ncbi:MAG TPA: glucosidase, partial [Kineosporiaceae bacterium]|nr:glucosidase [Kineosporiaceae bacterium]
YTKADPTDILVTVRVTNPGPVAETLHVLPTAWFRNTWSWDADAPKPVLVGAGGSAITIEHPFLGSLELLAGPGPDGVSPVPLFCENETNLDRLYGVPAATPYPKDGIHDHVIGGAATVNPDQRGTKCAFWYRLTVAPGETAELRLRLAPAGAAGNGPDRSVAPLGDGFERVVSQRRAEADEFYAELTPAAASADEAMVMRQAFSGMLWSKQLYYFDVARWLEGDPTQPPPPAGRDRGRNSGWRHFDAFDIMSMPDTWEYPWFAAWDSAFHCVTLAHIDPAFAKYQLILLCREWFQNPNGALPAYEWDFGDVNPPVQAWAAMEVFLVDGARDYDFLSRVFDKLLLNFTWWVNREDAGGNNLFQGGFLGLDNIGPIDRSHLPVGGILEQSDATGWMAFYALAMGSIAAVLQRAGRRPAIDLVVKFLEHFAAIARAMDAQGLWDDTDGLYYDRLLTPDGNTRSVKVRSMVGFIPALSAAVVDEGILSQSLTVGKQFADLLGRHSLERDKLGELGLLRGEPGERTLLLSVTGIDRLQRLSAKLFDQDEFLSRYGLRALSAYHRDHPYEFEVDGFRAMIDYEPAESTTSMFGGNSNWRGPIWFPLNYLVISALERYYQYFGDELTIEYPSGSGLRVPLDLIIADLRDRLISVFVSGPDGRRPCFGWVDRLQQDPAWKDNLLFHEYFHGDNGAGLGASHQTGWTGLIADVIRRRHGAVRSESDLFPADHRADRP